MEPQIRYCKTSDGVAIAWSEAGAGPPLITTFVPFGGVAGMWDLYPAWFEAIAHRFRFVRYDSRGVGLSERGAVDFSMSAMERDLAAVIEGVGEPEVVLGGFYDSVPIMVTYAATHPERVSHLVLGDGWARPSDQQQSSGFKTVMLMMDAVGHMRPRPSCASSSGSMTASAPQSSPSTSARLSTRMRSGRRS